MSPKKERETLRRACVGAVLAIFTFAGVFAGMGFAAARIMTG